MDDADKHTERHSASLSPNEIALINQVRGQDVPMARWLREAAMQRVAAELGVDPRDLDGAKRRPAPRRRNSTGQQRRQQRKGHQT